MTLGFAAASWKDHNTPSVMVVGDTRLSAHSSPLTDAGLKTFELGGTTAMVAAGKGNPAMIAAEIVRPIIENHNRRTTARLGFYDTVRMLGFFVKRSARQPKWKCDIAIGGFLQSGSPSLAHLELTPERNRVHFFTVQRGGSLAFAVGNGEAKHFLYQGLAAARHDERPVFASGISLLRYMSKHPGAFPSVGGGISAGSCTASSEYFSWPVLDIDERLFLRGVDVTDCVRPSWPTPINIPYDETWCAALDRHLHQSRESIETPVESHGGGYDLDTIATPENLFKLHDDPEAFDRGIARTR